MVAWLAPNARPAPESVPASAMARINCRSFQASLLFIFASIIRIFRELLLVIQHYIQGFSAKTLKGYSFMNVLIVFCHPEPESFNGALKNVAIDTFEKLGHSVKVSDLHGEKFDPVEKGEHFSDRENPDWFSPGNEQRHAGQNDTLAPEIQREIERLEWADLVILQFPLWWHAQPAMLKGWFDRVFLAGKLYTSTMRYDRGYFKGKQAMCSVTTGAPETTFKGIGRGGNMETMLWPIQYSLHYMGFEVLTPFIAYGIQILKGYVRLEGNELDEFLMGRKVAWREHLENHDNLDSVVFPGWGDWDEHGNDPDFKPV